MKTKTTTKTERPGNMENVYENRNTLEYGKIISYEDKFRTLIIELSDGRTKSMTWATFKGAWRKKAHTEMEAAAIVVEPTIEDQLKDEGFSEEETEEITASVECGRTLDASIERTLEKREERKLVPMPGIEKLAELKEEYSSEEKPKKKSRGKLIEFNGKSQTLGDWSKELGVAVQTLYNRLYNKNMPVEEAFTNPIKRRGNN